MGRTEKSQGLAPPAVRKDIRAKQAKQVINKTIPALLASISRASKGVESSELIVDPAPQTADAFGKPAAENQEDATYIKRKGQGRRKVKNEAGPDVIADTSKPKGRRTQNSTDLELSRLNLTSSAPSPPSLPNRKVRILSTDTLTAAYILTYPSKSTGSSPKPSKKGPNVCILNMASPLRPGGGVLTGATSQEEFLCARTTLLPSLRESYYRLPEFGGIWSPDILVFHNHRALGDAQGELGPGERYWVDVVSAGMLRFPELEGGEDDEIKRLSKRDRDVVEKKMRAVLRVAERKGVKKIVLGAWGCGAYGNPVVDVAQAWKSVLCGSSNSNSKKSKARPETWPGIEEVVFAISNRRMAADFAHAFDKNVVVEAGPTDGVEDDEGDEEDKVAEELRAKILEMEGQISKVWNPDLKARMGTILEGLRTQLREREGEAGDEASSAGGAHLTPEDSEEGEDDEVVNGVEVDSGDEEEEAEDLESHEGKQK
jgi:uncharacterized protein (TIGR02452 family)